MSPRNTAIRNFFLGGILPLLAFVVAEHFYGPVGGIVAGLIFGAGEVTWELWSQGRVQGITIMSNALILMLGALSLWEENEAFFKLQPAIFMLVFASVFLLTSLFGKHFLVEAARKQNPELPAVALGRLKGLNTRLGFLFLALAALSAYSAFYWSTAAWATLKAVGTPVIVAVYMALEFLWIRFGARLGRPR